MVALGSSQYGIPRSPVQPAADPYSKGINSEVPPAAPKPVAGPAYGPFGPGEGPVPVNSGSGSSAANSSVPSDPYNYDLNSVNPMSDLSYQAYLRGAGYSADLANAQASQQRQMLNAGAAIQDPMYQQQLQQQLTGLGNEAAGRGSVRSSAYLGAQNQARTNEASQKAAYDQGINDQQAQVAFGLQNTLAGISNNNSEQDLAARQRVLESQNQSTAYQQALQQLGLA